MILYVNGDSHTAAAEAVNAHAFAEDDPLLPHLGRLPHPDNLRVSWGRLLADTLKSHFKCDAESAASNSRILRTTRAWMDSVTHDAREIIMVIQWSTWERREWYIDGRYYQINASGQDHVPDNHRQAYKEYIAGVDWNLCRRDSHKEIWRLHEELQDLGIKHVFFNGNSDFSAIDQKDKVTWGYSYIGPYDAGATFNQWLLDHGYQTVAPNSWHFGRDAHAAWARFVLQYIVQSKML